jgi:DNA ligase (NAD+)
VLVERAGDVIPYIVKSLPEVRSGHEHPIKFPTHCPVCGEMLFKEEDEAVWRCTNINCEAQVVERIIHFTSKDAMDIRGLGEANIRKFYQLGFLKDVPSIYSLPFDAIRKLEGFGDRSITNLEEAISASKKQPLIGSSTPWASDSSGRRRPKPLRGPSNTCATCRIGTGKNS